MSVAQKVGAWLEDRSGAVSAVSAFLDKKLPPRLPLSYTLGALALLLFGVQVVTGIFLAVYYAPTPDHAWDSVRFIDSSVTGGKLLRGLHHWGSSFMVVIVVLHLLRTFLYGSYKKPREVTWIVGVKLLLLVLAFGLTGYLLPWDQKAYWATVVTVRIAHSIPLIGPFAASVLGGSENVGALTLTRFYAIHVLILPATAALLLAVHLAMVQRHGSTGTPAYSGDPERDGAPFHPGQSVRDALAMSAVFLVLWLTALFRGAPLEPLADPSDAAYVPRPEWYFLGLFQLLKYFPGRLEFVGSVILPGLGTALLVLLPFMDRKPDRGYRARRLVIGLGLFSFAAAAGLTVLGAMDKGGAPEPARRPGGRAPFAALAGPMLFDRRECGACHRPDGFGSGAPLAGASWTKSAIWIRDHMSDPDFIAPGSRDPESRVPSSEITVLMSYLGLLKNGDVPAGTSEDRAQVALIVREGCAGCHKLDGAGGTFGPSLAGVRDRHDRQWIVNYLPDPEAVNPDAKMKSYPDLTEAERDSIARYLMKL